MTFRSLALSNIRGNWRSYSAFFLSSVFSVLIFYIYAAFLAHPDVVNGNIMAATKVRRGMVFCEYLIVIFSFLFVLYSNSAFLKTRKQEFGLFSLFGMTKAQLRRLVIYENTAIAVLAIAVGIGLGMLFSKLFFMALGVLLDMDETIPFAVPLKAVWLTGGGFFLLFMVISLWTALRIGRNEIIDLLNAARKPKGQLVYSIWLVALAIVCLATSYGVALSMTPENSEGLTSPLIVLVTVVIGTYFLFTQLSVLFLRFIQKRRGVYYKRTNMIVYSQLGYKIKDNARILFTVSLLSAVIMTALGAVYILQIGSTEEMVKRSPYSIVYIEEGLNSHKVIDPKQMERIIQEDGFKVTREAKFTGVKLSDPVIKSGEVERSYDWSSALIMSLGDYNKLASSLGEPIQTLQEGTVKVSVPIYGDNPFGSGTVEGKLNGVHRSFEMSEAINAAVINTTDFNYVTLVMDDLSFARLLSGIPEDKLLVAYAFELSNWKKAGETATKLQQLVPKELLPGTDFKRSIRYASSAEEISLTVFIGIFIALLFFIASGSMIYFKLFTELQEDQAQFKSLSRIGMTRGEIRKIVVTQIGIVFFVPCVVGIVHTLFAMMALDNLMESSNWIYSFVVIGIYIAMQSIYFLFACGSYMKSMLRGATA
ncbi:ABC transporter permease [Paenibacillus harenae]|uniref:ABC transporter permease n=1 Tax=Paenibacillus harenae TaxID=306543 RepID=UPI00278F51A5|nr:ABC transporter permease [Paenibacillus harenae]MDQ0060726.1 putative ABC transport system permease protein [Paenibacillus harenae]